MKKGLFLILLLACALPIIAGDGSTAQSPLTVSQALARKNDHKSYYVTGYVVGEYRDFSNNKHFYHLAPPFDGTSAYLIADDVDEIVAAANKIGHPLLHTNYYDGFSSASQMADAE